MVTHRSVIVRCALIAALPIGLGACRRADTLSALPSPNGQMLLIDTLVGTHDRMVCVSRSLSDSCSSRNAEVYVTDVASANDLSVRWDSNNSILVEVSGGKVIRHSPVSRRGGIKIRLVRHPDNRDSN